MMATSREAWERVLAAIETDMLRGAALLETGVDSPAAPDLSVPDVAAVGAADRLPADWVLPAADPLAPDSMPPLGSMPPVPPELSERILALRGQIIALQSELARAMRDLPRPPSPPLALHAAEVPAFFDRKV